MDASPAWTVCLHGGFACMEVLPAWTVCLQGRALLHAVCFCQVPKAKVLFAPADLQGCRSGSRVQVCRSGSRMPLPLPVPRPLTSQPSTQNSRPFTLFTSTPNPKHFTLSTSTQTPTADGFLSRELVWRSLVAHPGGDAATPPPRSRHLALLLPGLQREYDVRCGGGGPGGDGETAVVSSVLVVVGGVSDVAWLNDVQLLTLDRACGLGEGGEVCMCGGRRVECGSVFPFGGGVAMDEWCGGVELEDAAA
eukprot:357099-Chlamydomonas_euryale.AAC.3